MHQKYFKRSSVKCSACSLITTAFAKQKHTARDFKSSTQTVSFLNHSILSLKL